MRRGGEEEEKVDGGVVRTLRRFRLSFSPRSGDMERGERVFRPAGGWKLDPGDERTSQKL